MTTLRMPFPQLHTETRETWLAAGERACAQGDLKTARRYAVRVLARDPNCIEALCLYARAAPSPESAQQALARAAQLDPTHPAVRNTRRAIWRTPRLWPSAWRTRAWLGVLIVLALLLAGGWIWRARLSPPEDPLVVAVRQARMAWDAGDHVGAARFLEEAVARAPDDARLVDWLAQEYLTLATTALHANQPEQALPYLQKALALRPDEPAIVREHEALRTYLAGREAFRARHWEQAFAHLWPLYQLDPAYLDTAEMLQTVMLARAEAASMKQATAQLAFHRARLAQPGRAARAAVEPGGPASQPGQNTAAAGLPSLEPVWDKRIVVDISEQRMYVYENGKLKWSWKASTGEPGRPTVPGEYRVQSKILNARSNVWRLWMPYWLGIYWVGPIENGIHGLPVSDDGWKMWEGYIGTRVTYGCVALTDEHARLLWEWADIGTPVTVQW